jgi:L-ascorbate metabolism protein UlaG (beta-lactamase superfamily)
VVLPGAIAPLVEDIVSSERIVPVQPGDVLDLGGVECRVVPAIHGVSMDDAYGDGSALGEGPRFVGYVLGDGRRLYHAGDTIVTDALREALDPLGIDVALLPINGRDAEREARGIVGNMDAAEAVELAVAIGSSILIPYHWDGFAGNTVSPGATADLAAGRLHVVVPSRFGAIELP